MAVSAKTQMTFWGVSIALFIAFIWIFKAVLTPFVLGIVIAYLLNPLVKRFSTKGIKRTTSTLIILSLFFTAVTAIIILVAPVIAKESAELIDKMPNYLDNFFKLIQPYIAWFQETIGQGSVEDAKVFLKENASKILSISGGVAGSLAAGGQAIVGMMTTLVLTPLVAFYMMKEWPAITDWVENLIPRDKEKMIKDIIHQIDVKLSGFIRGQLTVAFFLGIIYAVALTIAGLDYGFLIGIGAGVLSIIPLVGSTVGLLVSVGVAWFQAGEVDYVLIIAAIFIVGQIIEGNILSPKLLGDSVGLHPLWILFALMAGGSMFGILGMILAVPVAAVIGVLVGFAILQYKKSPLYKKKAVKKASKKTKSKAKKA
jgi:predicted PurR-regulated permease PerM